MFEEGPIIAFFMAALLTTSGLMSCNIFPFE
jgi:hypothetical protein